jgi:hypothetical protein
VLLLRLWPSVTVASRWLPLPLPLPLPLLIRAVARASRAAADMLFLVLLPGAELLVPSIALLFLLMSKRCVRSKEEEEGVEAACKGAATGGGVVSIRACDAVAFAADVADDEDDADGAVREGKGDNDGATMAGAGAPGVADVVEDGPAIEPTPSLLASEAMVPLFVADYSI